MLEEPNPRRNQTCLTLFWSIISWMMLRWITNRCFAMHEVGCDFWWSRLGWNTFCLRPIVHVELHAPQKRCFPPYQQHDVFLRECSLIEVRPSD